MPGGISVIKSFVAGTCPGMLSFMQQHHFPLCQHLKAHILLLSTKQAQRLFSPAVESDPTGTSSGLTVPTAEFIETAKDTAVCSSENGRKELIGDQGVDEASFSDRAPMDETHKAENKVENHLAITLGTTSKEHNQVDQASNLTSPPIKQNQDDQLALARPER